MTPACKGILREQGNRPVFLVALSWPAPARSGSRCRAACRPRRYLLRVRCAGSGSFSDVPQGPKRPEYERDTVINQEGIDPTRLAFPPSTRQAFPQAIGCIKVASSESGLIFRDESDVGSRSCERAYRPQVRRAPRRSQEPKAFICGPPLRLRPRALRKRERAPLRHVVRYRNGIDWIRRGSRLLKRSSGQHAGY
jgi:hypothetical protein